MEARGVVLRNVGVVFVHAVLLPLFPSGRFFYVSAPSDECMLATNMKKRSNFPASSRTRYPFRLQERKERQGKRGLGSYLALARRSCAGEADTLIA